MWDARENKPKRASRRSPQAKARPMSAVEWVRERLGIEPDDLQARVLSTTSKRGILNCSRQWGKSTITAAKAVHEAYTVPGSLTIVVSPSARQSGEFVRKAAAFVRKLKLRVKGDGDNETSLALPNGSRIIGLPATEATIRGFSAATLLLIDEASRVSDEAYKSVRPMMATSNGALWLMSTPHGRSGFFYQTWVSQEPEWERISAPATECQRIKASFLAEERRAMGEAFFRQEYMCEFSDDIRNIFSRKFIDLAMRDDIEPLRL